MAWLLLLVLQRLAVAAIATATEVAVAVEVAVVPLLISQSFVEYYQSFVEEFMNTLSFHSGAGELIPCLCMTEFARYTH